MVDLETIDGAWIYSLQQVWRKFWSQGNRMEHPSHDEDESVEIGSGTPVPAVVDNATICLSNSVMSHASALNSSADTEDALHLTDDVFEPNSPSQRLLNLTDTVRRLTGTFQSHGDQHHQDGEWVYTSSGSESPVIHWIWSRDGSLSVSSFKINLNVCVFVCVWGGGGGGEGDDR